MATIEHQGQIFQVDNEGFLLDFKDWNEAWAEYASREEDIDLTDEHWQVIKALQGYYQANGIPPMVRLISKVTGFKLKYIYETSMSSSPLDREEAPVRSPGWGSRMGVPEGWIVVDTNKIRLGNTLFVSELLWKTIREQTTVT